MESSARLAIFIGHSQATVCRDALRMRSRASCWTSRAHRYGLWSAGSLLLCSLRHGCKAVWGRGDPEWCDDLHTANVGAWCIDIIPPCLELKSDANLNERMSIAP